MIDYCKNITDVPNDPLLEAKEIIDYEEIEEINTENMKTVSNQIVPTKEHIINMFSKEFVENVEKAMSLRVEQLKNIDYKFKFINIPSSFEEKSKEDFKQMFFRTPHMSGGSSHYSKNIERTANFGEAFDNLQPMQQAYQGTHKMTFMMTVESSTASYLGNQFSTMMKNAFPAMECQNQQLSILPNQQLPHPSNQLQKYQTLSINTPVITISSSDEAPPAVKMKLSSKKPIPKSADKENQCANIQKSIKVPIATNSSLKKSPIRVEKKTKRKERFRMRLPSESSEEDENASLRSRRLSDFVKQQRNSFFKSEEESSDDEIAGSRIKEMRIVLVDCMKKNKQIDNANEEYMEVIEDSKIVIKLSDQSIEDMDVIDEPDPIIEERDAVIEDPCNAFEDMDVIEELNEVNEELEHEHGNQTDDTISTITSDDDKFFFFEKYDKLRKEKRQMRLHERSIRRGLLSVFIPGTHAQHPVACSTLITPVNETTIAHPVACSTFKQPPKEAYVRPSLATVVETTIKDPVVCSKFKPSSLASAVHPRKSKSPPKAKKPAPKRQSSNKSWKSNSKKIHVLESSSSDNESDSSVSTITSDDVKFFEKSKYDKLREEKHALRAALRAERKKQKKQK